MRKLALLCSVAGCSFALGPVAFAGTVNTIANPIDGCSGNTALYDPGEGQTSWCRMVIPFRCSRKA